MNQRKWIISLMLTFFLLLIGMIGYRLMSRNNNTLEATEKPKERLRSVSVTQFAAGAAENYIAIDGRLSAYEQVHLVANVSGILLPTSKEIKKGKFFKKGDLLFDIDQRKAKFNLFALRSNLLNAITLIMPDLKLDYPTAFEHWKAYLEDFEVEEAVKPLPEVSSEQEKYYVAAKNIYQLYYNIKSAEATLSDFKIYAPFSGVITFANVFPGTLVMPGQALATIINTSRYELEAPVAEQDLKYLKRGNTVNLQADGSAASWLGKVERLGNQIDPVTQSIPVYISVSGKGLREGMYLRGQVKGNPLQDVVKIPKSLIVNQTYLFTLQDSLLSLTPLTIETRDDEFVYLNNFSLDHWVVISPPEGLFAGQKVIPILENTAGQ